jgi:hypothetical protein
MLCKFWIHLRALRYSNFTQINAKLKFRFKHADRWSEKKNIISIDFHHTAMFQQSKKWTLFVNNNRYTT